MFLDMVMPKLIKNLKTIKTLSHGNPVEDNKISAVIGSVIHPMVEEHYIQFIALETDNGLHVRFLAAGQEPKAVFELNGEEAVAVYEYCNLHGLWKKEI